MKNKTFRFLGVFLVTLAAGMAALAQEGWPGSSGGQRTMEVVGIVSGARAVAMIRVGERQHLVRVGDSVGGYNVVAIGTDSVALRRGDRIETLRPGATLLEAEAGRSEPPQRSIPAAETAQTATTTTVVNPGEAVRAGEFWVVCLGWREVSDVSPKRDQFGKPEQQPPPPGVAADVPLKRLRVDLVLVNRGARPVGFSTRQVLAVDTAGGAYFSAGDQPGLPSEAGSTLFPGERLSGTLDFRLPRSLRVERLLFFNQPVRPVKARGESDYVPLVVPVDPGKGGPLTLLANIGITLWDLFVVAPVNLAIALDKVLDSPGEKREKAVAAIALGAAPRNFLPPGALPGERRPDVLPAATGGQIEGVVIRPLQQAPGRAPWFPPEGYKHWAVECRVENRTGWPCRLSLFDVDLMTPEGRRFRSHLLIDAPGQTAGTRIKEIAPGKSERVWWGFEVAEDARALWLRFSRFRSRSDQAPLILALP